MSSFDYLKTAIKQQGCTLQQVADASGMTKGYLSQLLNAKIKSPSAQKLEALHRFLGLEFPRQKKTIGVVFGKFYPLHTGHIYLIQRACSQVDELHIIMGFDDTRDRALFEDSAMSQQPTVAWASSSGMARNMLPSGAPPKPILPGSKFLMLIRCPQLFGLG